MKYLLLLVFSFATFAQEGTYEVIIRKQEAKKSSRWTLASWLLLKENMRLQDQWLAMNSSSTILEMYVGARHANEKYFPALVTLILVSLLTRLMRPSSFILSVLKRNT
jgi:hypothetical protein